MPVKKIVIVFVSLVVGLCCGMAQSYDSFEELCNTVGKNKLLRGDFEMNQKNEKTGKKEVNSEGTFTLSADDGMIWFTEKPVKSVMVVTNNFVMQEINGKQRKIDGSKNQTFTKMATVTSSIFTGNYDELSKNFEITFMPMAANPKTHVYGATLIPTDKMMSTFMKSIDITISGPETGTLYIDYIKIEYKTGDTVIYRLKNQTVIDNLNSDEVKYFEK